MKLLTLLLVCGALSLACGKYGPPVRAELPDVGAGAPTAVHDHAAGAAQCSDPDARHSEARAE